jgi:hypothetical protein
MRNPHAVGNEIIVEFGHVRFIGILVRSGFITLLSGILGGDSPLIAPIRQVKNAA